MPASYSNEEEPVPGKTSIADYLDARGVYSFGEVESTQTITFNLVLKDIFIYTVGLLIVIALAVGSGFVLSISSSSVQDKEWARVVLSAIGGAFTGYALGRGNRTN